MNGLIEKVKEVLASVLPIDFIVLFLHFTIAPLEPVMLYKFLIGSLLIVIGLSVFLLGIDMGIEPIGHSAGNAIQNSNSYKIAITASLVLGFFISYAEPDLHILAKQINMVTSGAFSNILMVTTVSVGMGVMMTVGMLCIFRDIPLKFALTGAYLLIFIFGIFSSQDFLAIAFDSSGATTGAIAVPFMLAMSSGFSSMKKNSRSSEADSFGIIGIASSGAILGILVLGLFFDIGELTGDIPLTAAEETGVLSSFISQAPNLAVESLITLAPIVATYVVLQIFSKKGKRRGVRAALWGLAFTYAGLVLFMLGVNAGFMAVGSQIGIRLASLDTKVPVLFLALLLGVSSVLAEPAVHVLTHQIEDVTGGSVRRRLVLIFLSVAVGLAIFLSSLRILVPQLQLWMYLIPGFGLAVILAHFVPDLFVGMAFDAGGVASGPMTVTFSLAFVQGVASQTPTADVIVDGFGMIAIVAMVPIVAIELLGMLYRMKLKKVSKF